MKFNAITWLFPLCMVAGCAVSPTPPVIDVRDVSAAGGAPRVLRVVDLGTGLTPRRGAQVDTRGGQGRAVIGELLYILGENFGKQPRVAIAGRGTQVLAHTEGGGVLVRVPWGIDHGAVEIEVVHDRGRGTRKLTVQRIGLALAGGVLHPFRLEPDGAMTALDPIKLPDARLLSMSSDGSAAYAVGGKGSVNMWVIDLTGPKPKVVDERKLGSGNALAVVSSEQRPFGAVISDEQITLFTSENATNPTFYKPQKINIPVLKKGIVAAAMGGQARTMALLLSDLNELALVDMSEPTKIGEPALVKLLPGEVLSLVKDLRFSTDGGTLWVVSGDNARSVEGGMQPARLTMLRVTPGGEEKKPAAAVHKTWQLGQELAPMQLAVARGEPKPPGTAIRSEPSSSAVYAAMAPSGVLTAPANDKGMVRRSSLGQEPVDLLSGAWRLTAHDVVGKTQRAVGAGCAGPADKAKLVVVSGPAWEKGKVKKLELGSGPADSACTTQVRVQP